MIIATHAAKNLRCIDMLERLPSKSRTCLRIERCLEYSSGGKPIEIASYQSSISEETDKECSFFSYHLDGGPALSESMNDLVANPEQSRKQRKLQDARR
jgi:hypothetical protein